MLRMGQMLETPPRGALRCEATTGGNFPRSAVSYDDVADAIVALTGESAQPGPWARRACYLNYTAGT